MYMTSPHLVGTKLTPDSYYLDVVFLLCFLPKFRGKGNRKSAGGSLGKKTHIFLPPRAGPRARVPPMRQHATPVGRTSMAEMLSNLSATVRTAALQRFHLIRPFLEEGVPLPTLARQHGLSLRTARRWVQRYRVGGLGALAPRPRADKGARRALPPPLVQLVEAL